LAFSDSPRSQIAWRVVEKFERLRGSDHEEPFITGTGLLLDGGQYPGLI
jgi:hypothetical protein